MAAPAMWPSELKIDKYHQPLTRRAELQALASFPSSGTMAIQHFSTIATAILPYIAPLHVISFSTLLGTQLYQTFIITKVCFDALPRSAFTTLQKRLFPIYFQTQSLLILSTALTFPPYGPLSLLKPRVDLLPFAIAGVTSALNLIVYGPQTRQIMIDRIHQGTSCGNLVSR
jgi:hypothetical protein